MHSAIPRGQFAVGIKIKKDLCLCLAYHKYFNLTDEGKFQKKILNLANTKWAKTLHEIVLIVLITNFTRVNINLTKIPQKVS